MHCKNSLDPTFKIKSAMQKKFEAIAINIRINDKIREGINKIYDKSKRQIKSDMRSVTFYKF